MKKIFKYIEPLWLGANGKISIRRVLALAFSIDFIANTSFVIRNWELGKSYSDGAILLGVEAGMIIALLGLTTYSNIVKTKLDAGSNNVEKNPSPAPED